MSIEIFIVVMAFMFGASWASFFGVVFERGRRNESIGGRSKCACGRPLKWYENIPVFGWLRVMGKTKCCGTKIPVWYFITEVIGGILMALVIILLLDIWH
jgi:leader peptidase (prepilin peptidase)/N-methyltransferase